MVEAARWMMQLDHEGLTGICDRAKHLTLSDKIQEKDLLQERVLLLLFSGVEVSVIQHLIKEAVLKFHEVKWSNVQGSSLKIMAGDGGSLPENGFPVLSIKQAAILDP